MDNRFCKRTAVDLTAEIISDGKSFEGSIENISEGGIGYLINSSIKDSTDFKPSKLIDINFRTHSGNKILLKCEIVWFSRHPANTGELALGLKILSPPSEYKEWITNFSGSSTITKIK
jgi:hypothetical protein